MDSYIEFMDELNKIVLESNSSKEIIERVYSSQYVDLSDDVGIIYSTIKILKEDDFSNQFLEELINQGEIDLLKSKIESIGATYVLQFTSETKNKELTEFVGKNLKEIISILRKTAYIDIDTVEPFILNDEYSKEVIDAIPIIARNMLPFERVKLIEIIDNKTGKLGNIEDYLSDFLYVPTEKGKINLNGVLFTLEKIKGLDKEKLLQEINDNIENLIKAFGGNDKFEIETFLDIIKEIEDAVPKEAQNLINEVNNHISNEFENILKKYDYDINLLNSLRQFDIDNLKIKDIQDDIIDKLSGADLVRYIQSARENEGFDKQWDFVELTKQLFKHNQEITDDKVVQVTISKLLEELFEHEKIGVADIEYAGAGFYSFNIKIGNYILKLADTVFEDRNNIPNDKRILKPIIRQQNNQQNKQEVAYIFLEIQNLVEANWYEGLSDEEIKEQLYMIYSELRDRKIRWTDIKPENVGRLLRPNKENFKIETLNEKGEVEKKEIKSDNYAVGFTGEEPDEILGPGELVIIDIDYIYKEDEYYDTPKKSYYDEFEVRYQEEKKAKVENNITIEGIKEIIKSEGYTREELGTIETEAVQYLKGNNDIEKGEQ